MSKAGKREATTLHLGTAAGFTSSTALGSAGMRASRAALRPVTPPETRIYAIGDIHGRSDLLVQLLGEVDAHDRTQAQNKRRFLVFLGDFIDRGPDSEGVISILINDLPSRFTPFFLKGNHEALLLAFLADPGAFDIWQYNGGLATLASYGCEAGWDHFTASDAAERCREAFIARLPEAHLRFFRSLRLSVVLGDYLFVHAGLRPGIPIERQREEDLIWIRHEFLDHDGDFGKVVVHGHTPTPAPEVRHNRICIDTGAWQSGRLTALVLEDECREFLST